MEEKEKKQVNFRKIEEKWQGKWDKEKVFEVDEKGSKKKYYVLEMFPYPSGSGLHMGHAFNYVIGDIYARFKKMQGYNVLHPIGFDSLGLPAENAAIKDKVNPKEYTEKAITNFVKQMKYLGISYDWTRVVKTHDPKFYGWDQWIFLEMFKKGMAYKKKSSVNWCSKCNSVLANEQVHGGKCWRHGDTDVELKHLEQWFFRITEYANELYDSIDSLTEWPEDVKAMQKNWIGKSHGMEISFKIQTTGSRLADSKSGADKISNVNEEDWKIFTTRPDTIFGVTFMVVSAQHPKLMELVTKEQKKEVEEFLKKIKSTSEKDAGDLEKEGAFTGSYALNPMTGDKIPVYTGNFVVADYGAGMVMAVPAHDQRDFEFAKKYGIPIKVVINPDTYELNAEKMIRAFTGNGKLTNSGEFDGMPNRDAIDSITETLEKNGIGKKVTQFKLRDWLISRQRYWGTPIPIVYCDKCGTIPVPEKDLPVELPDEVKFGEGNPLATNKEFLNVKCPKCGGEGTRETDTMDTFVNSSWYFLRYCDPHNEKKMFEKKKAEYWNPIDMYVGGKEHACMHLIYFRFYTKFLRDLGILDIDEPNIRLFNQGMIHGEDGKVMSKSAGNGIDPLEIIAKYGADPLRMFLVSMASPDKDMIWNSKSLEGNWKFMNKVMEYFENARIGKSNDRTAHRVNKAILEVSEDIEGLKYNLAVIKLRMLFESFEKEISKEDAEKFIKMICPFCPHVAEELWNNLGNKDFVSIDSWPEADKTKIKDEFDKIDKAVDGSVGDILNILRIVKEKQNADVEKVYLYVLPQEKEFFDVEAIGKRVGKEVKVYAVNDKDKYDPQGKASKAKPGKPAIYVE